MKAEIKSTIDYLERLTSSIHGWTTLEELEFLYRTARSLKNLGVIVEIGSWQGRSTVCIAQGSKQGKHAQVYAIDSFTGSIENQRPGLKVWTLDDFKNNLAKAGVADIVTTIVGTSEDAAKNWNKPIEFLFIDGDHEYAAVEKDFLLYSPHLIDGGIVAFHDTTPNLKAILQGGPFFGLPGPRKVVEKYIFKSRQFKNVGLFGGIIYAVKCESSSWLDRLNSKICQLKMLLNYFIYTLYSQLKKIPGPIKFFVKSILGKSKAKK